MSDDKEGEATRIIDSGKIGPQGVVLRSPRGKFVLQFVRATKEDWGEIEGYSDEELIGRYVHSCAVLDYGCSVMDLQILNLRALELRARGYSLSDFQDDIQRAASSIEKFLCEATGIDSEAVSDRFKSRHKRKQGAKAKKEARP